MKLQLIVAAALFTGACNTPSLQMAKDSSSPVATPVQPEPEQPRLYARDGSVVSQEPAGRLTELEEPVREVDGGRSGSRMYLLELYQEVIDEREELLREVEGLNATLQRLEGEIAEAERNHQELLGEKETLQATLEELQGENLELARRLTAAQIGRLESEKTLLEAKIQWQKIQDLAQRPASSTAAEGR